MRVIWRACLALLACASGVYGLHPQWPTKNPAFDAGQGPEAYIQPVPGRPIETGFFGCWRSSGTRFHEGIDIKALHHNRRGEPTDTIQAILDGTLVHINRIAGNSNYGCYVVLYHGQLDLPLYSLYGHLSHSESGLRKQQTVKEGQTIGLMGRTSSNYRIPKEQAHVHLEIGLQLNRTGFDQWYSRQKFSVQNYQGAWSGLNLIGFDPLDFFRYFRKHPNASVKTYVLQLPIAFTIRVYSPRVPDFVRHYPALLTQPLPHNIRAWDIQFTAFGLPTRWTPVTELSKTQKTGTYTILSCDEIAIRNMRGCHLISRDKRYRLQVKPKLQLILEILFDL